MLIDLLDQGGGNLDGDLNTILSSSKVTGMHQENSNVNELSIRCLVEKLTAALKTKKQEYVLKMVQNGVQFAHHKKEATKGNFVKIF